VPVYDRTDALHQTSKSIRGRTSERLPVLHHTPVLSAARRDPGEPDPTMRTKQARRTTTRASCERTGQSHSRTAAIVKTMNHWTSCEHKILLVQREIHIRRKLDSSERAKAENQQVDLKNHCVCPSEEGCTGKHILHDTETGIVKSGTRCSCTNEFPMRIWNCARCAGSRMNAEAQ